MSIYDFQVTSINGKPVELSAYRGKVLLIVNTASRCSYSRQFAGLQKLYESHNEQGFEILGFPCNQFNEKEPGNNSEVREYCESNFGVTFPLFEKIEVRAQSAHPLFQFLTKQAPFQGFDTQTSNGEWMQNFLQEKYPDIYAGEGIKWNFTKFLIDRNGQVHSRYETTTEPLEIESVIESLLESVLTIASMQTPKDARAFKTLNEEWIARIFTIEEADRVILDNPVENIVNKGGDVLIARDGDTIVGCVALVPTGAGVFELSKMSVTPELRGRGYGRKIIHAAISRARELGATSLFLGSSTRLPNAVHLYESVGFKHVPVEQIGPMPYVRADVFMELEL